MAENSKIEWTHHTFNPWRGCEKVSPGCSHCYAETLSLRNPKTLGVWGRGGTRVIAAESYWRLPLKWDRDAAAAGERRRVFCASLADVFEGRPELARPRARLWNLIEVTPHLDWLLLTKRPENFHAMLPWLNGRRDVQPNVWLGVSVEDQRRADERIPLLLRTPARVRFLSCEPLLGPVDLAATGWWRCRGCGGVGTPENEVGMGRCGGCGRELEARDEVGVDWVIVGGESGPGARPMRAEWARSLVRQCRDAGVACFVKQLGAGPVADPPAESGRHLRGDLGVRVLRLRDRKGGDPAEWPEDLRVRQFPEV